MQTEPQPGRTVTRRAAAPPAAPGHPHAAAVALLYQEHGGAPRVGAKGRGLIAEEIVLRARSAGIFVHESREMVSLLMQVDLDQHIPPQLYTVVAELLSWIYRLEGRPVVRHPMARHLTAGASAPKTLDSPKKSS